jgi:DNA-binding MarR family transcriptional regulator
MPGKAELEGLKQSRRLGIGRLLLMARRDFLARLAVKLADRNDTALLQSSGALLPFIDLEGTRSTELARRLGVSKQAVGKRIRELEEAGFLKRETDAADGRAFLVSFTDAGISYLLEMHRAITEVEREYDSLVGAGQMAATRNALARIAYDRQDNNPGD